MNEQGAGRVTNEADSAFVSNVKYAITFRREFTREGAPLGLDISLVLSNRTPEIPLSMAAYTLELEDKHRTLKFFTRSIGVFAPTGGIT
jgi:hypothetical protein